MICGKPVPGYKPQYCCDGRACGCYGQPVEPCVCGSQYWDALMSGIGETMEERRIAARIEKWRKVEPGQEAYEAFYVRNRGIGVFTGSKMPTWNELPKALKNLWAGTEAGSFRRVP